MAMKKYDGWAVRNKWGTILIRTAASLKRDVIGKLGGKDALSAHCPWLSHPDCLDDTHLCASATEQMAGSYG